VFKRFSVNFALLAMAIDAALTVAALELTELLRVPWLRVVWPDNWQYQRESFMSPRLWPVVVLLWLVVFISASVYDSRRNYKAVDEFQHVVLAAALGSLALAGLLYLTDRQLSRWLFVLFLLLDGFFLLLWRALLRIGYRLFGPARSAVRRVLIVGAGEVGRRIAATIAEQSWMGLTLEGYLDDDPAKREGELPVLGSLDDAERIIRERAVDEVVIALPVLHAQPVHVHVIPDYFAITLWKAGVDDFAGVPMIDVRAPALNDYQRAMKRAFDLLVGSLATLVTLPAMVLVALAIKLDSRGPVFYRQRRVGENGRLFWMVKFRSMIDGADKLDTFMLRMSDKGTFSFKRPDDPRVTRVGHFLRRTSMDELPQLFNVLKGEMSLVGPRPELPWMVDMYQPWQRKRFAVPQGITGWWQVNGRSDKEMYLHTEEDLYYLQNYSIWLDLVILVRTIFVVLRGRGAY
jgi:exopolysaccharide biosynthesis polyprenyl glycosylphosphotransferase